MATPSWNAAVPLNLSEKLRRDPQAFELLQALLLLEREHPQAESLGSGTSPQAEAIRLRGPLTPLFAASEIESLTQEAGQQPTLSTPVFGLGGPDGPCPTPIRNGCNNGPGPRIMRRPNSSTCSSIAC